MIKPRQASVRSPPSDFRRGTTTFRNRWQDWPRGRRDYWYMEPVDSFRNYSMVDGAVQKPAQNGPESAVVRALGSRSVVLVGMMGAGTPASGRTLAARPGMPFIDADGESVSAAGMTISETFEKHREPYFRAGEARVIARVLDNGPQVLATGGGSLIDAQTRTLIREKGVSI